MVVFAIVVDELDEPVGVQFGGVSPLGPTYLGFALPIHRTTFEEPDVVEVVTGSIEQVEGSLEADSPRAVLEHRA